MSKEKEITINPIAFEWLQRNQRSAKPRSTGLTEIRAAYYSNFGSNYFKDILETSGNYVDSIKFAGGSFTFMNPKKIREINDLAHEYGTLVSTGGFIEYVLTKGKDAVKKYIQECKELGLPSNKHKNFSMQEPISSGSNQKVSQKMPTPGA